MNKIRTIIRKEWAEVFKNRMVLFTVVFLPLLMTALPLIILFTMRGTEISGASSEMPAQFSSLCPANLSGGECFQVYMVSQFMLMFMILPMAIPITISAYSIVGEKATRSLEPLLATPITTLELLVGKSLASLIPAVVATYAAFLIFAIVSWLAIANKVLVSALLDARWLIAIFIVGPLIAISAIMVSLMVSSRVNDPRAAEQISMVLILPILAAFFGQISGLFIINQQFILLTAIAMIAIDIILVYLSVKLFQREVILTRWK